MSPEQSTRQPIEGFLADTLWFPNRLDSKEFLDYIQIRASQGFQAIQLTVCIPPECGPFNRNVTSEVGSPWIIEPHSEIKRPLRMTPNQDFLNLARERVRMINDRGMAVIAYEAWGNHIEWIGTKAMKTWCGELISKLNDLNVIYCLSGETNILIGAERILFPDKSMGDLASITRRNLIPDPFRYFLSRYARPHIFDKLVRRNQLDARIDQWSEVAEFVAGQTNKPLLLHPAAGFHSHNSIKNPEILSAVTTHTGHFEAARRSIWKSPQKLRERYPNVPYINLESWYEGIKNRFGTADQLFSFWTSMLSGAVAHCYGAHGIWNAGKDDGFLNYWGKQTFTEAIQLKTPALIGKSYKELINFLEGEKGVEFFLNTKMFELIEIGLRTANGKHVFFYPNTSLIHDFQHGDYFDPLKGAFINIRKEPIPSQLVVFRK